MFVHCYNRANSNNTKDFFQKLESVCPYSIKHIQTDNGGEFHKNFADYIKKNSNTIHFWNYKGQPYKNEHIEKYNKTIQDEFIDWNEHYFNNINQFNQKLVDWLIWYNTKRPHWSLNLTSPMDYLIRNNHLSRMRWTDTKI
ncbi:integrase core domain-containing protein [Patescibacteria group bacterium]|nr:integrase core domain-containing protein [Patescibacteria group bacterium]MBU1663550.1 integrase core domain-containing protein [Patescibacteria group bacterium]MBU1933812.1 integrase core domain-containing protein [Patescibacteria group bacterium]MBU2007796.1 integrase core domain-containing protein [Patescibacteria group bacterium]MBU2233646.1 integrase core domain-containing protein [Patescibacteria group bacterium]